MKRSDTLGASGSYVAQPEKDRAAEWHHEHIAELARSQAQQLIETAGSPDVAKHAIDIAAKEMSGKEPAAKQPAVTRPIESRSEPDAQTKLAHSLGYACYVDLFESSKPAGGFGERHWFVTAVKDGAWARWNDQDFEIEGRFISQQAAFNNAASPLREAK